MIEVSVLEIEDKAITQGHGLFSFSFVPRIGEIVQLPSSGPSLEFYRVEAIEHTPARSHPVTTSERRTPAATITVRWSHDWDVPDEG